MRQNRKVLVDKEIITNKEADTIEFWKTLYNNNQILENFASKPTFRESLPYVSISKLARCLEIGYLLQSTPQQDLVAYYNTLTPEEDQIVKQTLDILNVKIPPIN